MGKITLGITALAALRKLDGQVDEVDQPLSHVHGISSRSLGANRMKRKESESEKRRHR